MSLLKVSMQLLLIDVREMRTFNKKSSTFAGQEWRRFAKRFRRQVVTNSGVRLGKMKKAKNKNIRSVASPPATPLNDLRFFTKISKFLRIHEKGGTITPKSGKKWLFVRSSKKRFGKRKIVAKVRQVKIKGRLGWRRTWERMRPDLINRTVKSVKRAVKVSMSKQVRIKT